MRLNQEKFYCNVLVKVYENVLDRWSKYHHRYIRVIITYLTAEWKRATLALAHLPYDDHHTAKNLTELLKTELDKWRLLGRTQFLTSDLAANMMAMGPTSWQD